MWALRNRKTRVISTMFSIFRQIKLDQALPTFMITCIILVSLRPIHAKEIHVGDEASLKMALIAAKPGDEIRIKPGRYKGGISIKGLAGSALKPINIMASDSTQRPVFEGGESALYLSQVSYLKIDGLEITKSTANGLNIDHGGDISKPSHHIEIKNLKISEIGGRGNHDGIKLSGVDHFQVTNSLIQNWGGGGSGIDMVGCHDGLIYETLFRGRGDDQSNGVQAKGGSSEIAIQACRFEYAGSRAVNLGGSTGLAYFSPKDATYEAKNLKVMDCVILGSHAAVAFVGVDGAILMQNTLINPGKYVFRILQEQQGPRFVPCRLGVIEKNLVVYNGNQVSQSTNIGPGTDSTSFELKANCWSEMGGVLRPLPHGIPEKDGVYQISPTFLDMKQGDFRQTTGSKSRQYGSQSDWASRPHPL